MTVKDLLLEKGFIEGADYSYTNGKLEALPKKKKDLVLRDPDETHPDPWYEEIEVTYYVDLPELSELRLKVVKDADPALIISDYLESKKDLITEDDSVNIDLVLNGSGGWNFKNIPRPSLDDLYNLAPVVKSKYEKNKIKEQRMEAGKKARIVCEQVLDLMGGFNLEKALTIEDINQMQLTFSDTERALRSGRPTLAKSLITDLVPDEVILTTEMKTAALELLVDY